MKFAILTLALALSSLPFLSPAQDPVASLATINDAAAFLAGEELPHRQDHPRIPTATLHAALDEKLGLACDQGLAAYVVTQFSFAPNRIA
ncbi:MAG: hypothetical protein ABL994_11465, partial [Verrucomicrobiales bacterium]